MLQTPTSANDPEPFPVPEDTSRSWSLRTLHRLQSDATRQPEEDATPAGETADVSPAEESDQPPSLDAPEAQAPARSDAARSDAAPAPLPPHPKEDAEETDLMPDPEPEAQPGPDRLAERLSRRRGDSTVGRGLRKLASVLITDDTPDRLVRAIDVVQATVTTNRRIAVVGACGGVGASTIAVALGQLFAGHRSDRSLVVNAAPVGDLAPLVGCANSMGVSDFAAQQIGRRSASDPLPISPSTGLSVLNSPATNSKQVVPVLHRLGRYYAITVTDVSQAVRHPAVTDAHVIVLVVPAAIRGLRVLPRRLERLRNLVPDTPIVVLTVATGADTGVGARKISHLRLDANPAGPRWRQVLNRTTDAAQQRYDNVDFVSFAIPADRHLGGGAELHLARCRESTLVAVAEAGAGVLRAGGVLPVRAVRAEPSAAKKRKPSTDENSSAAQTKETAP